MEKGRLSLLCMMRFCVWLQSEKQSKLVGVGAHATPTEYDEKLLYPEDANLTLNLKQTARRSSFLTFGRYVCAYKIPATRLKSAESESGSKGLALGLFLSPISFQIERNRHQKHNLTILFRAAKE